MNHNFTTKENQDKDQKLKAGHIMANIIIISTDNINTLIDSYTS